MKILFSNLPWWTASGDGGLRAGVRAGSRWPFTMRTNSRPDAPVAGEYLPYPMFLGFAAAWAKRAFHDAQVTLRDSLARRESYHSFMEYLFRERPDYLVVESATPSWGHDKELLRIVAEALPAARVIVTGTITTTKADEITAFGGISVLGEYEQGVAEAVKVGGAGIVPRRMLTLEQMNSAPFPLYDEEYALSYFDACPHGTLAPELVIWTTRGCTYKCCFCAWPAVMTNDDPDGTKQRKVRFYSPEYVEGWIRHRLAINLGIRSIRLDDDTMNFGDKHTLGICAVMKRIGLPWSAMCRADTVKLETWNAMKDAGCFGVKIGMESGSQVVIDTIVNKRLDLADIEARILPHLKSIGLAVHTTWTVGLPGETPAQANETLRMIERLYGAGLHQTHQLSGTATIEGTPLDKIAQGQKLKAYPAATNEGFAVSGDGQAKVEGMTRAIR